MRRRAVPDSRLQAGSSLGAQCNRSAGPAPSSSSKATTARASTGCTTGRTASSTATPRRGRGPGADSQPRSRTWRATGVTEASSTTTGYCRCSWRVGIPALPSHTALLWRRRGVNRGAPCCAEPVPMHTCVLGRPPRLPVSPSPHSCLADSRVPRPSGTCRGKVWQPLFFSFIWTVYHVFLSHVSPHTRRSTSCPCLLGTDWWL